MDLSYLLQAESLVAQFREFLEQGERLPKGGTWQGAFARWLLVRESGGMSHSSLQQDHDLMGPLVLSLVNIAKNMVGDFLKKTPLSNIMEYQFLMVLRHHGRQSKSGIIDMNRMEMSSGIEIIRRLIKNGWALEEENPDDKRAKYIKITKGGEKLLDELEPAIASLYGFLGGGLEGEDRSRVEKALEELVSRLASR